SSFLIAEIVQAILKPCEEDRRIGISESQNSYSRRPGLPSGHRLPPARPDWPRGRAPEHRDERAPSHALLLFHAPTLAHVRGASQLQVAVGSLASFWPVRPKICLSPDSGGLAGILQPLLGATTGLVHCGKSTFAVGTRVTSRPPGRGRRRPPPAPTERSVRIYRTTLFGSWFTALLVPAA